MAAWTLTTAPSSPGGTDPSLHLGPPSASPPARGTSVVLVVVDTLRADHVGAWGYDRPTTPRIDALAARGARFTETWSTSSWTRPAVGSLVTGAHARTLGIAEERYDRLPAVAVTLAERLRDAGWLTLGVTSNPNINAFFGFEQGFDAYWDSGVVFKFMPTDGGYRRFGKERNPMQPATETTDRALALVDRYDLADRAFYLQVLYIDPHFPYAPPKDALAAVGGGTDTVSRYDGDVRYADAELGRLLDGLDARGLLRDTLVIVTSDHGEGLDSHPGQPWAASHGDTLYESVLHVPLVITHPDLPGPVEVTALTSSLDVVPTVLDAVGLPAAGLPGASLWPAAHGEALADTAVIAETDWRYAHKLAIVTPEWHLVSNLDAAAYQRDGTHEQATLERTDERALAEVPPVELYARGVPIEQPAHVTRDPVVEQGLLDTLIAWDARTPVRPPEHRDPKDTLVRGDGTVVTQGGEVPAMDEGLGDQLRTLGYLGDGD